MGILDNTAEGAATGTAIAPGIGTVIGAGIGLLGGVIQNSQQQSLIRQQMQNQITLGQNQQQLQEQTWRDTSYPAQVNELEQAGMNPALIYSNGMGQGGTTGAPFTTSVDAGRPIDFTGKIAEGAATAAKAIEENTQATKTAGPDTANTNVNTQKQATEIPKIEADTENTKVSTQLENADLAVKGDPQVQSWLRETVGQQYQKIWNESHEAINNLEQSDIKTEAMQGAKDAIAKTYNAQLDNLIADTIQKQAGAGLDRQAAEQKAAEIMQKWKDLNLHQTVIGLEHGDRLKMMNTILEAAGISAAGNVANSLINLDKGKIPQRTGSVQTRTLGYDAQGNPATVIQTTHH
nr:MAG: DNA pilot protein [Microviridae sp.]